MFGTVDLRGKMELAIKDIMTSEHVPDNPIYRVIESNLIQKSDNFDDKDKIMISRMERIEENLNNLLSVKQSNIFGGSRSVYIEKDFFVEFQGDVTEDEVFNMKQESKGHITNAVILGGMPPEKVKLGIKVLAISLIDKNGISENVLRSLLKAYLKNIIILSIQEN
ncbi:MAG: hypothetical protein K0Q73_5432 [Paenibacillus sp.]|jgi:hypothetical protein|nr:hypothetical protein [Paenibacillus sp.]